MEFLIFFLSFCGFCIIVSCMLAKSASNLRKRYQEEEDAIDDMIAERINELVKEVIAKENMDIELTVTGEQVNELFKEKE